LLEADSVTKDYSGPAGTVRVLNGITLSLKPGDAISIMGPSGSGKSTLLSILGAMEAPSSGRVTLDGDDPFTLAEPDLARFRNRKIGFVFQDHCLLPQCTVLENVLVPTLVGPADPAAIGRAKELLDQVGLEPRMGHLPSQLSGGEKQRAAIARALIREPRLLLCDEPTGNLDSKSAGAVADLLLDLSGAKGTILIVVTHSIKLAARTPAAYELEDGLLVRFDPSTR
jgi:lipoprotein-releasing system ATP-binding protein